MYIPTQLVCYCIGKQESRLVLVFMAAARVIKYTNKTVAEQEYPG